MTRRICGAILGVSLLALAVLSVVGCIWFFAFVRQIFRAYGRFHRNALAPCRARGVCRVLRACLYRVQPVRRKP